MKFSAIQENITANKAHDATKRWMNGKPQICWKCQKDKPTVGGSIKFFGSVRRFICKECVDAKQRALAEKQEGA